jgi:hypothetical protein
MTFNWKLGAAALAVALAAPAAHADLIIGSGAFGPGTVIDFESASQYPVTSPTQVGGGTGYSVLFSTSGAPGSLGLPPLANWSLGDNGSWGTGRTFAGVDGDFEQDGSVVSMAFDFGAAGLFRVGGFLNFDPVYTYGDELITLPLPLNIAAYASDGTFLEDHELPIFTGPDSLDDGAFYGIARAQGDISRLVITGPYAVVDNLTFAPVPEPSTYAMLVAGLGLIGFFVQRSRRA